MEKFKYLTCKGLLSNFQPCKNKGTRDGYCLIHWKKYQRKISRPTLKGHERRKNK